MEEEQTYWGHKEEGSIGENFSFSQDKGCVKCKKSHDGECRHEGVDMRQAYISNVARVHILL